MTSTSTPTPASAESILTGPSRDLLYETTPNYSTPIGSHSVEDPSVPHCLGIDEAGRGPVLDSKQLTAERRAELFDGVLKSHKAIGWKLRVLTAAEISGQQLRKRKNNLNSISHQAAISLVADVLGCGVNLTHIYVDTVGDPSKYQALLSDRFPSLNVTVCKKADSLYPVVSAASICAKVTRDRVLDAWRFTERHLRASGDGAEPMGCGYPGDGLTKAWLRHQFHPVCGFPDLVRFDWSTAKLMLADRGLDAEWYEEDEDGAAVNSRAKGKGKGKEKPCVELDCN